MKLKKIASLALAGIMAVSMLAGCKDGGNSNSGSSSSEITAPTGYTATIYGLLNSKSKSVMSSENSNILSLAVDASVKALDNDTFKGNTTLTAVEVQGHVGGSVATAVDEMDRNVDGKWSVYGTVSGEDDSVAANYLETNLNDGETKVFVMLAPTSLNDTQINSGVAGIVNDLVEDLDTNNATSTVSYKMSADRELIGSSNAGIYLIAVAISMNVTAKA